MLSRRFSRRRWPWAEPFPVNTASHHQAALYHHALGEAGVKALKAVKQAFDPKGILNPGKIW